MEPRQRCSPAVLSPQELLLSGYPGSSAHAGSRTRVTSMGGLYDAARLRALLAPQGGDYSISAFDFSSMHVIQWLRTGSPCVRNGFDSCARGSATAVRHGWRRLWSLDRSECCAESTEAWTLLASLHTLRTPGVEPGSQAWGACMMPLHYVRCWRDQEVTT